MATATNTAQISFGVPTAAWGTITHFVVRKSGGGTIIAVVDSSDVTPDANNNVVLFNASTLNLVLPSEGWTPAGAKEVLEYFLDNNATEVSLHTGTYTEDTEGTEVSGGGYERQEVAAGGWTVTE